MCNICHQHKCPSMCPNADEPRAVYICSECGELIREGEYVWHIMGEQYCEHCIDDFREEAEYIDD